MATERETAREKNFWMKRYSWLRFLEESCHEETPAPIIRNKVKVATNELAKIFDMANEKFFNNEVKSPEITIQSAGSRNAYGWCSVYEIWKDSASGTGNREINICAEYLNRPIEEIAGTIIHEMVHLHNLQNGIIDCSSNQYHNKKFKKLAEASGLQVEVLQGYGYARTALTEETALWLKSILVNTEAFTIHRIGGQAPTPTGTTAAGTGTGTGLPGRKPGNSKMKKWSCGCTNVRCAVELKATCEKCGNEFLKV